MNNTIDKNLYTLYAISGYTVSRYTMVTRCMQDWPSLYYQADDGEIFRMIWMNYLESQSVRDTIELALNRELPTLLYPANIYYDDPFVGVIQRALMCIKNNTLRHDSLNALATMPLFSADEYENYKHFVAYILDAYDEMITNS